MPSDSPNKPLQIRVWVLLLVPIAFALLLFCLLRVEWLYDLISDDSHGYSSVTIHVIDGSASSASHAAAK